MENPSLLHGLNPRQSLLALWKLMFSPALQLHFGPEWTLGWCEDLLRSFIAEDDEGFRAQYDDLAGEIEPLVSGDLRPSIKNLPWAMMSLDLRTGMIPWVTPLFDRGLHLLLSTGTATERHFGDVLPIAFCRAGGPGTSTENAIRISAQSGHVRAAAEHWIMRAYLERELEGMHASLKAKSTGRTYSRHNYTDAAGAELAIYFDTTESWNREQADFLEFLEAGVPAGFCYPGTF
jgi:hypothetical protein